jgi:hypothetical protein
LKNIGRGLRAGSRSLCLFLFPRSRRQRHFEFKLSLAGRRWL